MAVFSKKKPKNPNKQPKTPSEKKTSKQVSCQQLSGNGRITSPVIPTTASHFTREFLFNLELQNISRTLADSFLGPKKVSLFVLYNLDEAA